MVFKLDLSEPWELLDTYRVQGTQNAYMPPGWEGVGGVVHESSNEAQKQV